MSNKKQNKKDTLDNIIENTFSHIKDIVDANTVVGSVIELTSKLWIIPVSKISVGLISGGGNNPKSKNDSLSAGSGTGFNIVPIGFVTISDGVFNFIKVGDNTFEKNIGELLLGLYDKFINKKDVEKNEKE